MFAQQAEQTFLLRLGFGCAIGAHKINADFRFARRKTGAAHAALAPAGIFIIIAAEADDSGSPHQGIFAGNVSEQLDELTRFFLSAIGLCGGDKCIDICIIRLCLDIRFRHYLLLIIQA